MRMITTGVGAPPLVFVHGWACDGTDWRAQVDARLAPTCRRLPSRHCPGLTTSHRSIWPMR
ncbi:hypothetical protein MHPYR_600023 [uncultured Mycobacterium sp.]|uniref:Uncharacterized protein n=1 Tax=uncultured Mycobacterium sp. TaxID=171292 RepID=A0A1Y5PN60_9MYCO|nr:hypothetical protein MHPYR_600023 [uncultured Mycobacterium sp.]